MISGLIKHRKFANVIPLLFCLQVRTLFVSGLPVDIKPRELYLLFRPFKVSSIVSNAVLGTCDGICVAHRETALVHLGNIS